jgi:hypothetical protein
MSTLLGFSTMTASLSKRSLREQRSPGANRRPERSALIGESSDAGS